MSNDQVKIDDGRRASELLKNEILQKALAEIRSDQMRLFENSEAGNSELREEAYRMLKSINLLIRKLESIRAAGVMEASKPT